MDDLLRIVSLELLSIVDVTNGFGDVLLGVQVSSKTSFVTPCGVNGQKRQASLEVMCILDDKLVFGGVEQEELTFLACFLPSVP